MYRNVFSLAAVLFATAAATSAMSAQQLDQSNVLPVNTLGNGAFSFGTGPSSFKRVQTITVGLTGVISQIDVQYYSGYPSPTFTGFEFFGVGANGTPINSVIGTGSLTSQTNGWASFSTNLSVIAGRMVAFGPIYTASGAGWMSTFTNTYSGGGAYNASGSGAFFSESGDYGFRSFITTDAPAAVPEPASWAMMVVGFGALGATMRRRRVAVRFA